MTNQRGFVVLAVAAAMIAAGCASSGAKSAPAAGKAPAAKPAAGAKPADPKAAPAAAKPADPKAAPAAAKPADPKAAPAAKAPEVKPADPKAAPAAAKSADPKAAPAKAGDPKAVDPKAAPAKAGAAGAAAAPAGRGFWASYDEYVKKLGGKLDETKFLGLRIRPKFSDELAFTDNVYYQDANEKLVVNLDPPPVGDPANPNLGEPRGEVSDIVNTATLRVDLEMPLNLALVPLIGMGKEDVKVFGAEITSVEYLVHADSPDAINWNFHLDLPYLVNDMLTRLMTVDANRHAFYVRVEGDYAVITDPLDVAKLEASALAPTFNNTGERNSFRRNEWWAMGTAGWKSPLFDSKISYRQYRLQLEDDSLKPADHYEQETYAEIGHHLKRSEHRVYGFWEYTDYNFDNRGSFDPNNPQEEDTQALRDFAKIRTGMGWEGPLMTKKLRGGAELYYLATNVFHEGPYWTHPVDVDPGTGLPTGSGTQRFDERGMVAGRGNLAYRPFVTKGTQIQAEYERNVDFSVVAQDKLVDKGSISLTHPVNERLTGEAFLGETMENMQHREKRLYTEFGIGARYKIATYTELSLRYTLRHMRSRREPVTAQSDGNNFPYYLKADGDFTANIVSLGISISF